MRLIYPTCRDLQTANRGIVSLARLRFTDMIVKYCFTGNAVEQMAETGVPRGGEFLAASPVGT